MNAKLFINYRREDTAPYAHRLCDHLIPHFGKNQVFIDIDQIDPGEDFVKAINGKVGTCDIVIVAIGPRWLNATDASGSRRLDNEGDFVRMEIVAALQRNIPVIPVLFGRAQMPRSEDLPEALAPISRRNAFELSETRFHADVNRLIEKIKKSLAVAKKQAEPSARPAASHFLITAISSFAIIGAYGVAVWVLLINLTGISEFLALPQWTDRLIIILLLLGFPATLLFAWRSISRGLTRRA